MTDKISSDELKIRGSPFKCQGCARNGVVPLKSCSESHYLCPTCIKYGISRHRIQIPKDLNVVKSEWCKICLPKIDAPSCDVCLKKCFLNNDPENDVEFWKCEKNHSLCESCVYITGYGYPDRYHTLSFETCPACDKSTLKRKRKIEQEEALKQIKLVQETLREKELYLQALVLNTEDSSSEDE
jgi:hypothetical protein